MPSDPVPLIVRFGAFGDMVLTTALARALWRRHGRPCTVVGVGDWVPELMRELPFVGDVRTIGSRGAPYWLRPDQWRLVAWLRSGRYAPVYLLQDDRKSLRLLQRAGLTVTASHFTCPPQIDEHVIDHHARLAGLPAETTATGEHGPELRVSATESQNVETWLAHLGCSSRPLVLIQPGNKRTMKGKPPEQNHKHWPEDRWLAVIAGVLAKLDAVRVLILGAPSECEMTEQLARQAADPRVISVAREMSLRRLFALQHRAHSLISIDTGTAHAAAAIGCPLVVLFGTTDPRRIRPIGATAPVVVVSGPPGAPIVADQPGWAAHHSMADISAEAVLSAWRELPPSVERRGAGPTPPAAGARPAQPGNEF